MTEEFKRLNAQYNDETYLIYPYVSKNRPTLLPRGLYRKHKANYRGITAVYDTDLQDFRFFLYGMYKVDEDLVVVPEGLELSPGQQAFLDNAKNFGFKQVERPPKFETIEFSKDSPQAKMALENKASFYYNKMKDMHIPII